MNRATKTKEIGIVGAGNVGEALAKRLVELGYPVKVANSRGAESLREFAGRTGAKAVNLTEVSSDVDILIIAIPLQKVRDLPESLISSLPQGSVVVDTGNYIPQLNGVIEEIEQGLPETAWVSGQLGVPVVKAFNSLTAFSLANGGTPKSAANRIALPVAGDDAGARAVVMELVEELGFTAFDAGPLAESWRQQPGQPAYATDPTGKELLILLGRADRKAAAGKRDQAMQIMAKLPPNYPVPDLVRAGRFTNGLDRLSPRTWLAMLRLGFALRSRH